MRNKQIMNAYDSINPSLSDKQRMLDSILAEGNFKEAPRKVRASREPVVYTQKQPAAPRRHNRFGPIAAAVALVLAAGIGVSALVNRQSPDITANPPVETITPIQTAEDHYALVLEKYRRAATEGWTKEQCEIEGISTRMQAGYDFTKAGYALLDLDGNGREELLIAEESTDRTDNIWDFYTTLEDGTPIQLWVDEQDGGQCRLHEENVISISYSNKHELELTFYDLKSGNLVMREMLQWEDEDTVFHTDANGNTRQVTSREGQSISNAYENQKLDLTWLADISDSLRDTGAVEVYMPVLEKYRTAIDQGWERTMCRENNISMRTPIENADESLYYAFYDLNNDGIKELIISEYPYREDTDTSFIDIFTYVDGEVKNVMSMFELAGMRSLCEGGFVKDLFMEPGMEYDKYAGFLKLEADRFVTDFKVYQKDGKWFTEGDRGVGEFITREEADEIVAQYPPLKLDYTEIKSSGEMEYQSGYETFDYIIQKYVTAINEGWTEDLCEQNDISPEILSDTAVQHDLGWCLLDIDENGVEELIISDGVTLFDLYVMQPHNGGPGHLICTNGGETWQLCENGVIQNRGFYSSTTAWRNYTLIDTDIIQQDIVFYDGELNQYYYGSNGEDLEPIDKNKVGNLLAKNRTMELTLTPFVERPAFLPDEAEYYEPLLDIYRQAIRENWKPGQCVENGISLMIGYYGDFVEELGYTTMDLDNNGIQELIITDGTNIYDLYTIIQDEQTGPLRLVDAMERIEYFLTEDSMIYCSGSGGAGMHVYSLSSLEGRNLRMMTGFMYAPDTDAENPWFWYDGKDQGDPCGFDAEPIIDNWKTVRIPFVSFE